MKNLVVLLTICISFSSFGAVDPKAYYDNQERVEKLLDKKAWVKLLDDKSLEKLNKLSGDERFKLANYLQEEGYITKTLFLNSKNKIGLVKEQIQSGKLSIKDREVSRLSLFLISNIELK